MVRSFAFPVDILLTLFFSFDKLLDKNKSNFFFRWFIRLLFVDANLHKQISHDVREEKNWTKNEREKKSTNGEGVRLSAMV